MAIKYQKAYHPSSSRASSTTTFNTGTTNNRSSEKKHITYGKCRSVNETFKRISRIGRGTYGTVYKAKEKHSGLIVALKKIKLHHESSDGFPLTSIREISILKMLEGAPSIVSLLDVVVSSTRS